MEFKLNNLLNFIIIIIKIRKPLNKEVFQKHFSDSRSKTYQADKMRQLYCCDKGCDKNYSNLKSLILD